MARSARAKRPAGTARAMIVRQTNTKAVLDGMLEGKTTRELADELGLSIRVVNDMVNDAYRDLPPLDVESWRQTLLEQSMSIIKANAPKKHMPQNAKVILQAQKMIGDIVGAFAPKEVDISGTIVTAAAGDELMAKLAQMAGAPDVPEIEVTLIPNESDEPNGSQPCSDAGGEAEEDPQEPQP